MATDWQAFLFLLGEWEGGNESNPSFSFSFALDGNILVRKNRMVIHPTSDREGYTHDDLLTIYNEVTGLKRAIYFDNEDHVIHYEVSVAPDQKTIARVNDPVPTAPLFRFTYVSTGEVMDARLEIAPPGEPDGFIIYIEGPARRIS